LIKTGSRERYAEKTGSINRPSLVFMLRSVPQNMFTYMKTGFRKEAIGQKLGGICLLSCFVVIFKHDDFWQSVYTASDNL
jgi:hypothetical protein